MGWHNVQEMPIHHDTEITEDQVQDVLDYNLNDVLSTRKFYFLNAEKIEFRRAFSKLYKANFMNRPDVIDFVKAYTPVKGTKREESRKIDALPVVTTTTSNSHNAMELVSLRYINNKLKNIDRTLTKEDLNMYGVTPSHKQLNEDGDYTLLYTLDKAVEAIKAIEMEVYNNTHITTVDGTVININAFKALNSRDKEKILKALN
jgi:hypothetical protein